MVQTLLHQEQLMLIKSLQLKINGTNAIFSGNINGAILNLMVNATYLFQF